MILVSGPMLIEVEKFLRHTEKVSGRLLLCGDHVLDHLVESIPNLVRSPVSSRLRLLALYWLMNELDRATRTIFTC